MTDDQIKNSLRTKTIQIVRKIIATTATEIFEQSKENWKFRINKNEERKSKSTEIH